MGKISSNKRKNMLEQYTAPVTRRTERQIKIGKNSLKAIAEDYDRRQERGNAFYCDLENSLLSVEVKQIYQKYVT